MFERTRLTRFLLAGASGFTADALLLSALVSWFGWSPYLGRALSLSVAIGITWYLNRTLTFGDRPKAGVGLELARYALVQGGGVVVNYGVFATVVALSARAERWPLIALFPAAAAAMWFTYVGMHYFAFPRELEIARD
jgi:putative flippase GtrA